MKKTRHDHMDCNICIYWTPKDGCRHKAPCAHCLTKKKGHENKQGKFKIIMTEKLILDVCCGSRQMWFNKNHPNVIYMDKRSEDLILCNGRQIKIRPTIDGDFTAIPFPDHSFQLVVMDPPHLKRLGSNSYTAMKYGKLLPDWETDLKAGFDECMRVLGPAGILIFKWNEYEIPISKILSLFGTEPLFGHKSGKHSKTHWLCFMKIPAQSLLPGATAPEAKSVPAQPVENTAD